MRFSVIIPLYNKADWIIKALDSVKNQTFKDFEIIVTDDGSTDESGKRVLMWSSENKNIQLHYFKYKFNKGCAFATDMSVKKSNGELCTILDGDDYLELNSLETIHKEFEKYPQHVYMWTKYMAAPENSTAWKIGRSKDLPKDKPTLRQALLSGWWGALAQRTFRREAYLKTKGLNHQLRYAVDQQLASLFADAKVRHIPFVTYRHIQHKRQMSAVNYKDQQRCRKMILQGLGGKYVREK